MKEKEIRTLITSWKEKKKKQPKITTKANSEILRLEGMLKKRFTKIRIDSGNKIKKLDLELKNYNLNHGNINSGNKNKERKLILDENKIKKDIENHIGAKIHQQLILGYGKLEDNPYALRKLNNYYTKFQENIYSTFKHKYPNIDKNIFHRTFTAGMISWIQRAGNTILHESGHYHTSSRHGRNPTLGYTDKNGRKINNITVLDQFLATLFNKGRAHVIYGNNKETPLQDHAEQIGNGINQNTQYSRDIYEEVLMKGGKYSFIKNIAMNGNGLYGLAYVLKADSIDKLDDVTSYLKTINTMNGTNYNIKDLRNYSLLSVLSGSTISGIRNGFDYIWSGKTEGELIGFNTKFGKVMLPEFHTWLGKNGVSVEMTNYIKTSKNSVYKLGFNTGVMGNKSNTMILGVTKNWKQMQISAQGSLGDNKGVEIGIKGNINRNTSIYAKGGYSDDNNMFNKTGEPGWNGEVGVEYEW